MKTLVITILILSSCISAHLKAQPESVLTDSGNYCLWYDNMLTCDSVFLSFLQDTKRQGLYVSKIPTSHKDFIHNIKQKVRVPELVFRNLLNYTPVNQSYSESTKQNKIAKIIKYKTCYYCGKVIISKKFDSHLFFVQHLSSNPIEENNDIMIDDKVILINMVNNSITSVSCILSYFCWDGYLTYNQIDSYHNNDFIFFSSSEDECVVEPNNTNTYRKGDTVRFRFNDIGQIIILPL